jgi:hypothetical protein
MSSRFIERKRQIAHLTSASEIYVALKISEQATAGLLGVLTGEEALGIETSSGHRTPQR